MRHQSPAPAAKSSPAGNKSSSSPPSPEKSAAWKRRDKRTGRISTPERERRDINSAGLIGIGLGGMDGETTKSGTFRSRFGAASASAAAAASTGGGGGGGGDRDEGGEDGGIIGTGVGVSPPGGGLTPAAAVASSSPSGRKRTAQRRQRQAGVRPDSASSPSSPSSSSAVAGADAAVESAAAAGSATRTSAAAYDTRSIHDHPPSPVRPSALSATRRRRGRGGEAARRQHADSAFAAGGGGGGANRSRIRPHRAVSSAHSFPYSVPGAYAVYPATMRGGEVVAAPPPPALRRSEALSTLGSNNDGGASRRRDGDGDGERERERGEMSPAAVGGDGGAGLAQARPVSAEQQHGGGGAVVPSDCVPDLASSRSRLLLGSSEEEAAVGDGDAAGLVRDAVASLLCTTGGGGWRRGSEDGGDDDGGGGGDGTAAPRCTSTCTTMRALPHAVTVLAAGQGGTRTDATALASLAAQDLAVLDAFDDGLAWLSLGLGCIGSSTRCESDEGEEGGSSRTGKPTMTPLAYRDALLTVCSHLALTDPGCRSLKSIRQRLMGFAFESDLDDGGNNEENEQATLADLHRLKALFAPLIVGRRALLVLNDVQSRADLDLFCFGRAEGIPHRILATTRKIDLAGRLRSALVHVIDLDSPPVSRRSSQVPPSRDDDDGIVATVTEARLVHHRGQRSRSLISSAAIPYDVPHPPRAVIDRADPAREIMQSLGAAAAGGGGGDGDGGDAPPSHATITVLTGMGGSGKTTLAGLIAHDPAVLAAFPDGLAWVSVGSSRLTPVGYRDRLLTISVHLALTDREVVSSSVRQHLEGFEFGNQDDERVVRTDLLRLKAVFAPFIARKRVLVVLDDVRHREDLALFSFCRSEGVPAPNRCSQSHTALRICDKIRQRLHGARYRVLATSPKLDVVEDLGSTVSRVVDLDLLSSDESLDLLEKESGQELQGDPSATEVVMLCGNLPLAISSVGVLMRGSSFVEPMSVSSALKLFSGGLTSAQVTTSSSDSCFRIFDASFRVFGEAAGALRMCFAVFCACFTAEKALRPCIPQDAVICLFEEMLSGHGGYLTERQRSELISSVALDDPRQSAARVIIERLTSIGFISVDRIQGMSLLRTQHSLQRDYGMRAALDFEQTLDLSQGAVIRANALLVSGYERRATRGGRRGRVLIPRNNYDWQRVVGDDRLYMLQNLTHHMARSDQNAKAEKLKKNKSFLKGRMETAGALETLEGFKGSGNVGGL